MRRLVIVSSIFASTVPVACSDNVRMGSLGREVADARVVSDTADTTEHVGTGGAAVSVGSGAGGSVPSPGSGGATQVLEPDAGGVVEACSDGLARCGQECVDTNSDNDHCGACGIKCTPECRQGVCAAGAEEIGVGLLELDERNVYWVTRTDDGCQLHKTSKEGWVSSLLATGLPYDVREMAVNRTGVYLAAFDSIGLGQIIRVPTSEPTVASVLALGRIYPDGIALDSTNLYFVDAAGSQKDAPVGAMDTVKKVPLDGSAPATVVSASAGERIFAIAVDDANVYWSAGPIHDNVAISPTINKQAKATGKSTLLATPSSLVSQIALDATHLYFSDPNIEAIPIAGGAPTTLATEPVPADDLAVDASGIYWTHRSPTGDSRNAILRISKAGETPVNVTPWNSWVPLSLTLDGTSLYWISRGGPMSRREQD